MLTLRYTVSDREFAEAWLREYFRRRGLGVIRVALGPCLMVLGASMVRGEDLFSRAMGIAALLLGAWYAFKPFLGAYLMARQRRRDGRGSVEFEVTLSAKGIRIDDGRVRTEIAWDDVPRAGAADRYAWFELSRGARATIPWRAVEDRDALRAIFERHTRWEA
ncbi:MAG: hypothetical protein AB7S26_05230 [Sandaracinaceae bacterium]